MDKIERSRKLAVMGPYEVMDTSSALYHGVYSSHDDRWSVDKYKKALRIQVVRLKELEMEFDIIGVDPSIVNAFRRILLSEVPSMAIDKVLLYNNTSVIPDEVLAHRIGLIPLRADPRNFEYRASGDSTKATEQDTLEFELKIKCSWNPSRPAESTDPKELYINHSVYNTNIKWTPIGNQSQVFRAGDVGPIVEVDKLTHKPLPILINKLRPGHELDMKLQAVKGIGKEHAKFSPVATTYYRLLPDIQLTKTVEGELATKLQSCFSPGVINIVEESYTDKNGKEKKRQVAEVNDPRYDSCSRNVLRHEDLADCVQLGRVKDHFIFTIESVGALPPDILFKESIGVLKRKCKKFLAEINKGRSFS